MSVSLTVVNCGTCTTCCQGDAIVLHPERGDDISSYQTEIYQNQIILAHKPNGDCIYLDRNSGCTIHDRSPALCRSMDCRSLLQKYSVRQLQEKGLMRQAYAARRLIKHGIGSRDD